MPLPITSVSFATDYDGAAAGVPLACGFDTQGVAASEIFLATLEIGGEEFVNVDLADYTVTDMGGGVFTVTPDLDYESGITVRVYRWLPYTQPFQFSETGPLPAAQIMAMGNRIVQEIQQLRGEVGLDAAAVTLPPGATYVLPTMVFADAAARGNTSPTFLGQLAVQLDTGSLYRGSTLVAGGWTIITSGSGGSYDAGNGLALNGSDFEIDTTITLDMATAQGPITNKTFSSPVIDDIATATGYAVDFPGVPSAVNHLRIAQAATGNAPALAATGTDTNVSLNLVTKGTGTVTINGVAAVTISAVQTLTNKTLTGATINTSAIVTATTTNSAETQQTLTDAASITWDMAAGGIAKVTLTDSRAVAAPTNTRNGAVYMLEVIQGTGGSHELTWDPVFIWQDGAAPTLLTAEGDRNICTFLCSGGVLYGVAVGFPAP